MQISIIAPQSAHTNPDGTPLHHSRRAYSLSYSKRKADLQAMLWAVESLCNMKQRNVQTETLLHPDRFPEVQHIVESINNLLPQLASWSLYHVSASKNKVAVAIANSVISELRTQSYVARGGLLWLRDLILQEALVG